MRNRTIKLGLVTLLTVARFPLILVFFAAAVINTLRPEPWLFILALVSLIASALTDLFDGYLARRFGVETQFGAHADPLMDKFFYLSTLPVLIFVAVHDQNIVHAVVLLVMTVMFLSRDLWVTFLRSIGAIYSVSGSAHWAGKVRTCLNFPLIGAIYFHEEANLGFPPISVIYVAEAVALLVNVLSMYSYSRYYWPYLRRAASIQAPRGGTPGEH